MKKILVITTCLLLLLVAVILIKTVTFAPSMGDDARAGVDTIGSIPKQKIDIDIATIKAHMSEAIRYKTISFEPGTPIDRAPFLDFISFLEQSYPTFHQHVERKMIADYTPLFFWKGTDESLKPVLLTGHYDVVPVIPGTESKWQQPPFAGLEADGYIYGRGALDDKSAVITLLEALEKLALEGFTPTRSIYISLGHDEEVGGVTGAAGVVEYFKANNVQLAWSMDEGSFLTEGILPIAQPVAMINVAEKGWVSMDVKAAGVGGHSSMPPAKTAVVKLSEAILKVNSSPLAGGISGVAADLIDGIGPYMPFTQRVFIANRWLFGGLLEKTMGSNGFMNAMMRTTIAPTMLSASLKENVLPIEAVARINFRLHPRDTPESVLKHMQDVLDGMEDITLEISRGSNASKVASTVSAGYKLIEQTSRAIYGDIVVVPGITVGGTDSKHYGEVTDDAYRYNPMKVGAGDISGFHGTNEKISVENLASAVKFYYTLVQSL